MGKLAFMDEWYLLEYLSSKVSMDTLTRKMILANIASFKSDIAGTKKYFEEAFSEIKKEGYITDINEFSHMLVPKSKVVFRRYQSFRWLCDNLKEIRRNIYYTIE